MQIETCTTLTQCVVYLGGGSELLQHAVDYSMHDHIHRIGYPSIYDGLSDI
jgi:hypothetical protein